MWSSNFFTSVILLSISPITTEIFAPAMIKAANEMNINRVEESVSIYFAFMATVHLLHGFIVVRIGQLKVGIYGLLTYLFASAVIYAGPQSVFIYMRMLQAVGASAASVVGSTRLRTHLNLKVDLPVVNACRAILLIVCPMLSQLVVDLYGWRETFALLCIIGLGGLITLCISTAYSKIQNQPVSQHSDCDIIVFGSWVVADAFSFASIIVWVAFAPFIQTVDHFGIWYGLTFVGSAVGALLAIYFAPARSFDVSCVIMIMTTLFSMNASASVTFVCMTISNMARGLAATHAQSQSLLMGPKPGKSAGILHSMRALVTSFALYCVLLISPRMIMVGCSTCAFCIRQFSRCHSCRRPLTRPKHVAIPTMIHPTP